MSGIFDYPPNTDDATKARTEQFFRGLNEYPHKTLLLDLIKQGICLEARYTYGQLVGYPSPLHKAVRSHSDVKILRTLVAAGADINLRDTNGSGLLHNLSESYISREVTAELIALGADPNALDKRGDSPLHLADEKHCEILIRAGASIEARNNSGETPLSKFASDFDEHTEFHLYSSRKVSSFFTLISRGANIYTLNNYWELWYRNFSFKHTIDRMKRVYEEFVETRKSPVDAERVYELLAITPLIDRNAPVDYAGNVRKIFIHAEWKDQAHAVGILEEMQRDGTINAETAESILAAIFPRERSYLVSLQSRLVGEGVGR